MKKTLIEYLRKPRNLKPQESHFNFSEKFQEWGTVKLVNMKELIIIETNQAQQVKKLLEKAHVDYKVYQEPKHIQKIDIFAKYGEAIKNKKREEELKLWDNADLDEQLNNDGEWWS